MLLRFTPIFMLILFISCSGKYDVCGGTQESKNESYRGSVDATEPYIEVEKDLWTIPGGCYSTGCDYFITVTVWLHNPLEVHVTTDVKCSLVYINGAVKNGDTTVTEEYIASTNTRKEVMVNAHSSKKVSIQHNVSASDTTTMAARCEANFQ